MGRHQNGKRVHLMHQHIKNTKTAESPAERDRILKESNITCHQFYHVGNKISKNKYGKYALDRTNDSKPLISLHNLEVKEKTKLPDFPAKDTEMSNITINTIQLETRHVDTIQKYSLKPLIIKIENSCCKTESVTQKNTDCESFKNLPLEVKKERLLGNSNSRISSNVNFLFKKNKKDWKLFLKFGLKDLTVKLEKRSLCNSNFKVSYNGIHTTKKKADNSMLFKIFGLKDTLVKLEKKPLCNSNLQTTSHGIPVMKRNNNDWNLLQKFGLKELIIKLENNLNIIAKQYAQQRISTAFPNLSYKASTLLKREPTNCTYPNVIHEKIETKIKKEKLY